MRSLDYILSIILGIGLLLLFFGEAALDTVVVAQYIFDIVGGLLIVFAIVQRLYLLVTDKNAAGIHKRFFIAYLIVAISLVSYFLTTPTVKTWLEDPSGNNDWIKTFQFSFLVLFVILLFVSILYIFFVELSYRSMRGGHIIDYRRIKYSGRAALIIGLFLSFLFVINYIVYEKNVPWDFTTTGRYTPTDTTVGIIKNLDKELKILSFYPPFNDVGHDIRLFLEDLRGLSEHLTIEFYDIDIEPLIAEEYNIRTNGQVVFISGDNQESVMIPTDRQQARNKLKTMERDFITKILKVTREQRTVYFTYGHGERSYEDGPRDEDLIRSTKRYFEVENYLIKQLGLVEGLHLEVPEDADIVVIIGPQEKFKPEELQSLIQYMDRGGRILLFMDPEYPDLGLDEWLSEYNLEMDYNILLNDQVHIVRHPDWQVVNNFTDHLAVQNLKELSGFDYFTVIPTTGSFQKIDSSLVNLPYSTEFIMRSRSECWREQNGNGMYDPGIEQRNTFNIGAAVETNLDYIPENLDQDAQEEAAAEDEQLQEEQNAAADQEIEMNEQNNEADEVATEADEIAEGETETTTTVDQSDRPVARMIVFADSHCITDFWIGAYINQYILLDSVHWLMEEEELIGLAPPVEDEDYRINLTEGQDSFVFYSSIFGLPIIVLAVGMIFWYRRQSQGKK